MTIFAVEYLKDMGDGEMQPQLFRCSDGKRYVVKKMSNILGKRALFNELISYRLGKLLKLNIAKGRIIYFSKKWLKDSSILRKHKIQEGPHFGSLFLEGTSHFTEQKLSQCTNIEMIPRMIVFDHWISNYDRRVESQNLLFGNGHNPPLILIDHADAFNGPNWDINSLSQLTQNQEIIWGKNYQALVPYMDPKNPFEKALALLDSITNEQIAAAVLSDIPKEWQVSYYELKILLHHLIVRKNQMRNIIGQLKPYFPKWNSYR